MSSSTAMRSIVRSVAKTAAVWPIPRQGPTGVLLLAIASVRTRAAGKTYGANRLIAATAASGIAVVGHTE